MFEKEAKEYCNALIQNEIKVKSIYDIEVMQKDLEKFFQDAAEFGYNKAKEELILKLKNEGIVKLLKDSIFRNGRLSSQEQQELCAWIECAMDFREYLDECVKELEELHKTNEWHYVKDGDLPKDSNKVVLCICGGGFINGKINYVCRLLTRKEFSLFGTVYRWKEIVLPKESE